MRIYFTTIAIEQMVLGSEMARGGIQNSERGRMKNKITVSLPFDLRHL